jgi:geranylgeranyl reductase family protein
MHYPVVVVGAGPAGLFLARLLAADGLDVAVLEEHASVGKPEHCTGLFSPRVLRLAGVSPVIKGFTGAVFHGPDGKTLTIQGREIKAYVVDRVRFDRELAGLAAKEGAHIHLETGVREARREGGEWVISTEKGEFRADILIGADGAGSAVRRMASIPCPAKTISTVQAEASLHVDDVHVFLGSFARGFFGWAVPHHEGMAKVGVGVPNGNALTAFDALLKRIRDELGDARILSIRTWTIPVGGLERYSFPGGCLVGDAAALAKATTGGGVFTALRSAQLAADAVKGCLRNGKRMVRYDALLKRELLPHVRTHMRLHSLYSGLTERDISYLFSLLSKEENADVVASLGDVDFPLRSIFTLIRREPRLIGFLPKLVKAVR